jgi:diadenylate cyclase
MQLSRTLGSRHRAAIGVTEDTDALVVVVSEETGTISLVAGGEIRRGFDAVSLKAALGEALERPLGRRARAEQAAPAAQGEPR